MWIHFIINFNLCEEEGTFHITNLACNTKQVLSLVFIVFKLIQLDCEYGAHLGVNPLEIEILDTIAFS